MAVVEEKRRGQFAINTEAPLWTWEEIFYENGTMFIRYMYTVYEIRVMA